MRTSLLLLALALLFAAQPSLAQQRTHRSESDRIPARITYRIQGSFSTADDSVMPLPLSIMERLERQSALAGMTIEGTDAPRESGGRYEMRFVFSGMDAFHRWYLDEATQALLGDLQERSSSSSLDYVLQVRRSPNRGSSNE